MSAHSLGSTAKAGARILSVVGMLLACVQTAQALPSFARQTGQQCVACHNGFPELTPYGRQFKLNGYTFTNNQGPLVPLAALFVESYSHTQKALDAPIAPGTSRNDNLNPDVALLFYGGKIADNIGAYASGAYVPLVHQFSVGHTDIRYANSAILFGKDATFGVSINNSPGQTDPWNSSQNFSFYPYDSSIFTPSPVASPAVQGRYASEVIGGTAYISWNQLLYAAAGAYTGINPATLNSIGISTRGLSPIMGAAPYWRLAVEPAWGHNTWEFGTFGTAFSAAPHDVRTAGTDKTYDVGVDTEYQYFADINSVSVIASYIFEHSSFDASKVLGFSDNSTDSLRAINAKATYTYDQNYSANLGYFRTTGSRDQALYGSGGAADGSPNSAGVIAEVDYYAFNRGGPDFWDALNLKVGLQYVVYTRFDGATKNYDGLGRNASDNNTLLLYTWLPF
jgi:hypothetical protein